MVKISGFETHGNAFDLLTRQSHWRHITTISDVRFPTSLTGDGSDAMYAKWFCLKSNSFSLVLRRNTDCDYSSAYLELFTDSDLVGYGMTFTLGRGNDIVSYCVSWIDRMKSYKTMLHTRIYLWMDLNLLLILWVKALPVNCIDQHHTPRTGFPHHSRDKF